MRAFVNRCYAADIIPVAAGRAWITGQQTRSGSRSSTRPPTWTDCCCSWTRGMLWRLSPCGCSKGKTLSHCFVWLGRCAWSAVAGALWLPWTHTPTRFAPPQPRARLAGLSGRHGCGRGAGAAGVCGGYLGWPRGGAGGGFPAAAGAADTRRESAGEQWACSVRSLCPMTRRGPSASVFVPMALSYRHHEFALAGLRAVRDRRPACASPRPAGPGSVGPSRGRGHGSLARRRRQHSQRPRLPGGAGSLVRVCHRPRHRPRPVPARARQSSRSVRYLRPPDMHRHDGPGRHLRSSMPHTARPPAAHIVMDPAVRVAAMRALASVLRSSPAARDVFLSGDVPWAPTPGKSADGDSTDATLALSAAQAALRHALRSATDAVRDGAAEVLRAFFQGSPDGQLALASTLAPLSGDDGEATFGTELLSALCGKVRVERTGVLGLVKATSAFAHALRFPSPACPTPPCCLRFLCRAWGTRPAPQTLRSSRWQPPSLRR